MASGFFALLDDIGAIMDDVAVMSKVTTKKTAGILGDDLAVNAEKASGFVSSREIPVLWAISKGSMLNKLIILPVAFLLSAFIPVAVTIILLVGGVYLAYEGAEKVYHFLFHKADHHTPEHGNDNGVLLDTTIDPVALEKEKIKSAIITDFILSVEIVIIALGTVADYTLTVQILVVTFVAIIATVGVYGLVALIVRMDDLGLRLLVKAKDTKGIRYYIGQFLVNALPWIIKSLSVIGTIALLLVAGGIFVHNLDFLHHVLESWPGFIRDFIVGMVVGIVALMVVMTLKFLYGKLRPNPS